MSPWWVAALAAAASGAEPGWLLRDARVVDADGARRVAAIEIRGDRIARVGEPPEDRTGLVEIDLGGATVTPGLIDAHVHLSLTPSGAFLDLDEDAERALWRRHLAAYVACGVTTVLDTGILPEDARAIRDLAALGPAPDIHLLGPLLSPEGGYPAAVLPAFPAAPDAAAVAAQFAAFDDLAPDGAKLTFERGMVTNIWPLYPEPVRDAIRAEAGRRELPLFAHAMSRREVREALSMPVDALVHTPRAPGRRMVRELAERDVPVVSTLSAFEANLAVVEPERMALPPVPAVAPPVEIDAALDPEIHRRYARAVADAVLPRAPGFVRAAAARAFLSVRLQLARTRQLQRTLVRLHRAGVQVVLGSDSGNWPVFPFEFHGPTTLRELELLAEGGLDERDALVAATASAAELLGMEGEIGRVAEGYRADLVVVEGDPLRNLSVFRSPRYVMRAGALASPEGWMAAAGDPAP